MVPIRRDSTFVGRAQILVDIKQKVDARHSFIVLFGIGGIGKSQIAIEYCYRHSIELPDSHVFWIHTSNFNRFVQGYKDIARKLKLPGSDDPNVDTLQIVFEWLSDDDNGPWLMVLDNADDDDLLFRPHLLSSGPQSPTQTLPIFNYLPQCSCGVIFVTTRDRRVGNKLLARGGEDPIEVLRFDTADAMQLLQNKLHKRGDWNEKEAQELFETVDYLPLAIAQASSYISEQGIKLTKYLTLLRPFNMETKKLLEQDYYDPGRDADSQKPVLQTWTISIDQIRSQKPRAVEILSLMAMLDRQGVSDVLLLAQGEGSVSFDTSVGVLSAFSLIAEEKRITQKQGEHGQGRAFQMHRLVQFSMKAWLEQQGSLVIWQERALDAVLRCCPPNGRYEHWTIWEAINPHVKSVLEYSLKNETALAQRARLLNLVADYNIYQGHYESAHAEALEAFELDKKLFSEDHECTMISSARMAQVLSAEGNHEEALEAYRAVLKLREVSNGKEEESTLRLMNNVAEELHWIGERKEAESIQRVLLEVSHRKLGKDHPITLKSMNNLASLSGDENPEEAEKMFRNMLSLYQETLGENDPDSLWGMNDLAVFLTDRGRHQEASELYRIVYNVCSAELGSEHPHTLTLTDNLASCLHRLGNDREAEKLNRDALAVYQKTGVHTYDSLSCLLKLAVVLKAQGKYSELEELLRPCVQLGAQRGEILNLVMVMNCAFVLGSTLIDQKKFEENEIMLQKFYDLYIQDLGDRDNNIIVMVMNRIAVAKQFQKKYAEAEEEYIKALEISKEASSEADEVTILIMDNLQRLYVEQGRNEEAYSMLQNIYSVKIRANGSEHVETLSTMIDLAYVLLAQEKYDEAEALFRQANTLGGTAQNVAADTLIRIANGQIFTHYNRGHYLAAETMARDLVTTRSASLGIEAQPTLWMQNFLGAALTCQKKYAEAEAVFSETLSLQRKALGENHPDTQLTLTNLLHTYFRRDKSAEAEKVCGKARTQKILAKWREEKAAMEVEIKKEVEELTSEAESEKKEELTTSKDSDLEMLMDIKTPGGIPDCKATDQSIQSETPSVGNVVLETV